MFSPRARGCSGDSQPGPTDHQVFPACAGMFLYGHSRVISWAGFPRVRGDVPFSLLNVGFPGEFSPRARGCSAWHGGDYGYGAVFPACAGMFRYLLKPAGQSQSFPRVRGDVPFCCCEGQYFTLFSPRARGCSAPGHKTSHKQCVFPACAGMFHPAEDSCGPCARFPRVRGDVPQQFAIVGAMSLFSPRARGCSAWALHHDVAGGRFPRVRGDVPFHRCRAP